MSGFHDCLFPLLLVAMVFIVTGCDDLTISIFFLAHRNRSIGVGNLLFFFMVENEIVKRGGQWSCDHRANPVNLRKSAYI